MAVLLAAVLLAAASSAFANVNGQPASSRATAYPMSEGVTYHGDFQTQTETEYLSFPAAAGQTLHFRLRNTTASCVNPSSETPCPVFGTLVDSNGRQVGGEGSSAGTSQVNAGHSDVIDWTFRQGGTYYVAVDSSGDYPTFSIVYNVLKPVLASLSARSPQRGTAVRAAARLRRAAKRLDALLLRHSVALGHTTLRHLRGGRVGFAVKLNRRGRALLARKHRLRLKLRVRVVPNLGTPASLSVPVTLKG